jgi:septal ring factor EnvC (AmiA/AmiB activator)
MIRTAGTFALAAALLAGVAGVIACDKPGVEEQQKEQKAAQDNAEQQQRAARESSSAQADMNQKVATAQTDFEKTRESFRHDKQADLDDLDAKIAKLEASERTATGKAKADLDAKLPSIRAQRASFGADFRGLQATTAASWDDAKARVDKEWDSLKGAVDGAP